MIGIAGDVHCEFNRFIRVMNNRTDIDIWLQIGDLGMNDSTIYPVFPKQCYFIAGNHENWDEVAKIDKGEGPSNLVHIKNGQIVEVGGLRILGFGGNHSSKFFKRKTADLPQGRRRHFTEEEFELACTATDIDVFLSHEAPSPYIIKGHNGGIQYINEILKVVQPKLHIFGHHHYYGEYEYEGINSICLSYIWESYVVLFTDTLKTKKYNA